MMSFLTYIMGFFMNFELLPIMCRPVSKMVAVTKNRNFLPKLLYFKPECAQIWTV